MGTRDLLFIGLVLGSVATLGSSLYRPRTVPGLVARTTHKVSASGDAIADLARKVDASFRVRWAAGSLPHAPPASEWTVIRRLALALTGGIPSLEELRGLESIPDGSRATSYATFLLRDRRSADYLAERLARAFVGTEGGPFLIYRRRRFVAWLSDQIFDNVPYDRTVRALIATDGLWTDRPSTNFLTVTYDPDRKVIDPERLAGRVARAFLGIRIDCAQCHDHPFAPWKQRDFQGLAAFFGQAENGLTGVHDGKGDFHPTDRKTGKPIAVPARVPFLAELLPDKGRGTRREQLAGWLTDRKNPRLALATVNRVWALMFGRPMVEPLDDLGPAADLPKPLVLLAEDFTAQGYDLRRLIQVIAATKVFRADSAWSSGVEPDSPEAAEKEWAVFPITRLRPEQVVGSLLQAASLTTLDMESPVLVRIIKALGQQDFVKRYGDVGDDEFDHRSGTIPQRLLLLNGDLVRDRTKPDLFNAPSRIAWFAPTDRAAVEIAYLTVLTRRPTPEEARHFAAKLDGCRGDKRKARLSDLFWTLVNSTEFSWNH